MKELFIITFLLFLLGCTSKPGANQVAEHGIKDSTKVEVPSETTNSSSKPESKRVSTPIDDNIKKSLRILSDSGVFDLAHEQMTSSLDSMHTDYFRKNSEYKLLSYASGDIFPNDLEDYVFIIYDSGSTTISFIIYNSLTFEYLVLYENIHVEEGIDSDSCYYYTGGTLDYQLAQEIDWHKDGFLKNQISFKDYALCSAGTLDSNEDIIEERGCYSGDYQKGSSIPSICFATSLVYNNWDCLNYNSEKDIFEIYYGQAFAD